MRAPVDAEQLTHPSAVVEQLLGRRPRRRRARCRARRPGGRGAARHRGSVRRGGRSSARRRARGRPRPRSRAAARAPSSARRRAGRCCRSAGLGRSRPSAAARRRACPARWAPRVLQLGEELVDEVVARLAVALGQPQVLGRRSARRRRRDPRGRTRRRARTIACVGSRVTSSPASVTTPRERGTRPSMRAQRRRLADAVAAEQRRDAALGNVERDPLQDVGLARGRCGDRRRTARARRSQRLSQVRHLHRLVGHHRVRDDRRRAARRGA